MSMDHPFYEELRRRKHPAARWWVVGDVLYYAGLIPACIALSVAAAGLLAPLLGMGWGYLIGGVIAFPFFVVIWLIGAKVKGHVYVLAERDGIPASAMFELPAGEMKGIVVEKPDKAKGGDPC